MPDDSADSPRGQLASIERTLGDIQGSMRSILREMERDRLDSTAGRQRLYERMEKVETEIQERVEKVEKNLEIVSGVATQARDLASSITKTVTDEVKPQTDKIKALGLKGGGILAGMALMGGLGAGPAWAAVSSFFSNITK